MTREAHPSSVHDLRHGYILLALTMLAVLLASRPAIAQEPNEMPWWPAAGSAVQASPLFFSWPAGTPGTVVLEIQMPDASTRRWAVTGNTWTPDQLFQPGAYRWRVVAGNPAVYSAWREFQVRSSPHAFAVPRGEELVARATARARPRSLALGQTRYITEPALVADLNTRAGRAVAEPLPNESSFVRADLLDGRAAQDAEAGRIQRVVFAERSHIELLLIAWRETGTVRYRDAALARVMNLASWDPRGATGAESQDQASRAISWSLALAFDWLRDSLTVAQRAQIVASVSTRMGDFSAWLFDPERGMNRYPFNSHGATGLGYVAAISVLMAGEASSFDEMLRRAVPRYVGWPVPWGRDDGGFANGTAYSVWAATDFIKIWDVLQNGLGLPVWQSSWSRGFVAYLSHFLPPGAPAGVFGDETESVYRKDWATVGKAVAARALSPYSVWYQRNLFGEDPLSLLLYRPPVPEEAVMVPPSSLHVASIGWVAMHSSLSDRGRTSIYFRSGNYGSYNHSHADQNALVIHSRGVPLAIASGYYDYYGSPHWQGWYKQTLAHNAITYDGGKGQLHDTLRATGSIARFSPAEKADLVVGDATPAYGGALTRAVRTLYYVRPGLVYVVDALGSETPRSWEWNLHAQTAFEIGTDAVRFGPSDHRVCVRRLGDVAGGYTASSVFSVPPAGTRAPQHHLRWRSATASRSAVLIFLLDVGCSHVQPAVQRSAAGQLVTTPAADLLVTPAGDVVMQ